MSQYSDYFDYLKSRSRVGKLYRTYWLYPRLTRSLKGRTLDIGCGLGDMLAFRPGSVGADVNPLTIEYCKTLGLNARLMQPDILPFQAEEFDSVLLDNVLEHLSDPRPLLAEIRRVLVAGGRLLIGVPGERGYASDSDHKKYYDLHALDNCMRAAGFNRREEAFFMPLWESAFLGRRLKQYTLYAQFIVD